MDKPEILDLLFDQQDGLLMSSNLHSCEIESNGLTLSDNFLNLNELGFTDDLLKLMNDETLKDIAPNINQLSTQVTLCEPSYDDIIITKNAQTVRADHQYCSQADIESVHSDSGISGGMMSPASDSLMDSPFGNTSPRSISSDHFQMTSASDDNASSPLGCGVEDLQLNDFNFDNLDPSSLLSDDDILSHLISDTITNDNITLDLDDDPMDTYDNVSNVTNTSKSSNSELPFTIRDISSDYTPQSTKYPALRLSDEEKALLAAQGMVLPQNVSLTRDEERALKSVRRKKKKVPTATLR